MSRLAPTTRDELIRRLRRLGFSGPLQGGRHAFMVRQSLRLILPNPHRGDISVDLLARILRQADVSRDEWLNAGE